MELPVKAAVITDSPNRASSVLIQFRLLVSQSTAFPLRSEIPPSNISGRSTGVTVLFPDPCRSGCPSIVQELHSSIGQWQSSIGAAENDENDGLNPVFIDAHGAVSMSLHDDFGFFIG